MRPHPTVIHNHPQQPNPTTPLRSPSNHDSTPQQPDLRRKTVLQVKGLTFSNSESNPATGVHTNPQTQCLKNGLQRRLKPFYQKS